MTQDDKWTKLTIDRETLAKLGNLAEKHYRSIPGEIRYLVDRELDNGKLTAAQVAQVAHLSEVQSCEEATK